MSMFEPDDKDRLKVRRKVFLFCTAWAFIIWPNTLVGYHFFIGLPADIVKAMLVYMTTLVAGPLGAYLFACHRKDRK